MTNSSSNHFTCPSGGTWYVCPEAPHFVGCCSSDPCTNVDANSTSPCPDLYPASFDTSIFDEILPNLCIDSANTDWYTCNTTDPPFLGCCSSAACNTGCPTDDLLTAAWSPSRRGQFALFQDEGTGADNNEGSGGGSGLSGGAIAGIVVGAVAALVIVGALVWFFMRRRNKKATAMSGNGHTPSVVEGEHQRMYPSPASPYYYSSQLSSPADTTTGAEKDLNYRATFSTGVSIPSSLSPELSSESGRPISELHSDSTGSKNMSPGQSYGLGVYGARKPEPIQELDSDVAEVHELDGIGGNRQL